MLIARSLPAPAPSPRASSSHPAYDGPVTEDLISLGSELGCPYLAGLRAARANSDSTPEASAGLSQTAASSAALASAAGGLGLGPAAACCPRTQGA